MNPRLFIIFWSCENKVQVCRLGFDTSVNIWCLNRVGYAFCWKTRYSRSRIPVVGHPSSSDVIAPSNSTYNSTNVPIFKRFKLRLGKGDMTLLEVISSSEANIQLLKLQHSVFSRTLLKE